MREKLRWFLIAFLTLTLWGLFMKKNPSDQSMVDLTAGAMKTLKENQSKTQLESQTAQRPMNIAGGFVEWLINYADIQQMPSSIGNVQTTRTGRGFAVIFDESGSTPGLSLNIAFDNDNTPIKNFQVGDVYKGTFDRITITRPDLVDNDTGIYQPIRGIVKLIIITEPLSDRTIIKAKDRNNLVIQEIRSGQRPYRQDVAASIYQLANFANQDPGYASLTSPDNDGVGLDINGARGMRFVVQTTDGGQYDEPSALFLFWLPPNSTQWMAVQPPYAQPAPAGFPLVGTVSVTGQHALGIHGFANNSIGTQATSQRFFTTADIPVHMAAGRIFALVNLTTDTAPTSEPIFIMGYAWK